MKNKILKDHFLNPRNMGTIDNPSYSTSTKSDTCSDIVKMSVIIDSNGIVADIKAQVFGCGYSIAGTSLFTDTAKGKRVLSIPEIAIESIREIADDIPEKHISCIILSHKAFQKILEEYSFK